MNLKTMWIITRSIIGLILFVGILLMFVIEPTGSDSGWLNTDNLWEAVHPFKIWDGFALIFFVGFSLFVAGLLGKVYNYIQPGENSFGATPYIAIVCGLGMLLFFV